MLKTIVFPLSKGFWRGELCIDGGKNGSAKCMIVLLTGSIIFLFISCNLLDATDKHPVDICYMVADLKYNAKQGVKICEIQQASLSLFNGNDFRNEHEESIHKELGRTLSLYNQKGWIVTNSMADKNMVSVLADSSSWHSSSDFIDLFSNDCFLAQARQPVADRSDISSYQGFLYINWSDLSVIYDFEKRFTGMVVIDKSSFPFWIDKYLMTQLFAQDALLSSFKPRWGNYTKNYTDNLAAQIAHDLGCDIFVIKPRGEFLGKGVIIVQRENLDEVVRYIITKAGPLAESKDSAYTAWQKDTFDSFIVEEFVTSDPIAIAHLENQIYQPTMRVAFILVYNKGRHDVHFLGSYWKTPSVSLLQEGNFMEKNKDVCKPPYYSAVDAQTLERVYDDLRIALPLLHAQMIDRSCHLSEEYYVRSSRKKLHIVLQPQDSTDV